MSVDSERSEECEHVLDLVHLGFFIYRSVCGYLIAEHFRHPHCEDAFFENTFALDDKVVSPLQAVEVDVPIHPWRRRDYRLGAVLGTLADLHSIFFGDQLGFNEAGEEWID